MCFRMIAPLMAALVVCCCLADAEWRAPKRAASVKNPTASDQQSIETGKTVYQKQCQTCHGLDGLSKLPEAPSLAGQPEPYLVKSLDDYRKGIRKNDMMTIVAQPLTDQDVADLAAFYAAIEVTVQVPK